MKNNPHYLLEKFNGNLSIQEYRKLFKTVHFLQVVEKPMTRILPELHDDNEDNIENFYGTENTNNKNMAHLHVVLWDSQMAHLLELWDSLLTH
jgi:hypothetical protein